MYDQDVAFTSVIFFLGLAILLLCWLAEYFFGGDR